MPHRVAFILPALNEAPAIRATLSELKAAISVLPPSFQVAEIIVADNGSTDATAELAAAAGALVVSEPRRGYGNACLAALAALEPGVDLVVFLDADSSDDPADLPRLLAPLARGEADLVLGSRTLGPREADSLTPHQEMGNHLACTLMRWFFGAQYTDLGPFRAIRRDALARLDMRDANFGWTIEMQIKAHRHGLRVLEIPVRHRRRRAGKSKVSGNAKGSLLAGAKILWTILRYRLAG